MDQRILYKIAEILIESANRHELITYGSLSRKIDGAINPQLISKEIGTLSEMSYENGLPLISSIVINQESGTPGDGYYILCSELKGIDEITAMCQLEDEQNEVFSCRNWEKLLEEFDTYKDEAEKKNIPEIKTNPLIRRIRKPNNKSRILRKYWFIVHDKEAYEENSRLLGFNEPIYNAKNIKENDLIVYYLSGESSLKGIYKVCRKQDDFKSEWDNDYLIPIEPLIELDGEVEIKPIIEKIDLFKNKEKWYSHIQGTNAVRELSYNDYKSFEEYIASYKINNFDDDYINIIKDYKTFINETIEAKIKRIKRFQSIVNKLKITYENTCQIEGCGFTFKKKKEGYYSEAHHLEFLSQGGSQDESNVAILCPNHHRMFHYADVKVEDRIGNKRKVIINGEEMYIIYK